MAYPLPLRKRDVVASQGVVATNHPLASAAGVEMLSRGGNAVDAAIAALFALTVVEPMMVSIFGSGFGVVRDAAGTVTTLDNFATCPGTATETMFRPLPSTTEWLTEDDENRVGHKAVGVPGTLAGWAEALRRWGNLPLAVVIAPAIRYAADGYPATPYLVRAITENVDTLGRFPASAEVFLRNGAAPRAGDLITRRDYAETLRAVAAGGPDVLYHGPIGEAVVADMAANGGLITMDDLATYE